MKNEMVFYEIYDYYYLPFYKTLTFKILIVLGILSIGALLGYLFFKRRYNKQLPAWIWALQEISKLSPSKCTNKEEVKKFYFELTSIIKQYLDRRYEWKTLDKTDPELVVYLKEQTFDTNLLQDLQKMLDGAQWVKFANQDVIKTQAEADFKIAQQIIEKTRPTEEE